MSRKNLANTLGVAFAMMAALWVTETARAGDAAQPAATPRPIAAEPAVTEPAQQPVEPVVEVDAACEDAPVSSEAIPPADGAMITPEDARTEAAGCKPCKGRTWCKCTYNGMARASCDPCCYRNNIGVLTCLD